MVEQTQAALAIAANAGSYPLPDNATVFRFGLKGSGPAGDDLRRALARPVAPQRMPLAA